LLTKVWRISCDPHSTFASFLVFPRRLQGAVP
jgi:hypothetical protein